MYKDKKILLVEDDALIAITEKEQLENIGYIVQHVLSGEDAVQSVHNSNYDLILMDIDLGSGIDGTQAAQEILKTKDIPVVFLSSHTDPEIVEKTEKITSYGYVVKNSGIVVLDTSIKMALKLFNANQKTKQIEEALREQRKRIDLAMESASAGIWEWDYTTGLVTFDKVALQMLGYESGFPPQPGELWINKIHADDQPAVRKAYSAFIDRKTDTYSVEFRMAARNGDYVWVASTAQIVRSDKKGKPLLIAGIHRNISRQKHTELALLENKRKILEAQKLSQLGSWEYYIENDYVKWSEELYNIFELPEDKPAPKFSEQKQLYTEDSFAILEKSVHECIKNEKPYDINLDIITAKGSLKNITSKGVVRKDDNNRVIGCYGTAQDITNLKRLESESINSAQKAIESEEQLNAIFNTAADGMRIIGPDFKIKKVNDTFCRMVGLERENIIGKKCFDIFNGKHCGTNDCPMKVLHKNPNNRIEKEITMTSPDGRKISTIKTATSLTGAKGEFLGIVEDFKNMTEYITSQKALFEANTIINRSPSIAFLWRNEENWPVEFVSSNVESLIGYSVDDFIEGKVAYAEIIHKDDIKRVFSEVSTNINENQSLSFIHLPYRIITKDGAVRWMEDKTFIRMDSHGKITHFEGIVSDITERILAEEALRDSERRLALATNSAGVGIWDWDIPSNDFFWDMRIFQMYGITDIPEHFGLEFWQNCLHPDDMEYAVKSCMAAVRGEKDYDVEFRVVWPDGTIRWMKGDGVVILDDDGKPVHMIGTNYDITERKQKQVQLEEALSFLENVLDKSPFPMWIGNAEGTLIKTNRALREAFKLNDEHLVGFYNPLNDPNVVREGLTETIRSVIEQHKSVRFTMLWSPVEFGGDAYEEAVDRYVDLVMYPIVRNGKLHNIITQFQDITENKRAENEIQKQLTEKETLLREVHHRVKNNIANIEGFLTLQMDSVNNAEAKNAIKDAISRVQSMRILYDNLLLSKDLHEISVKSYTENLIDSLTGVFPDKDNINIEKQIMDFNIAAKKAITIGIILNELLTNVFKYAFKDNAEGTILISIKKNGKMVTAIIKDNGIGIDERTLKNKSPGFGLTIVKMLVEQLDGTYTMENDNGTISVINFEI